MKLYTRSRDKKMYYANCEYIHDKAVVKKGSHINRNYNPSFITSRFVMTMLEDDSIFDENNDLIKDIEFPNLSAAASFVTGRVANGNIVWKTKDGKALKYSI